MLPSRYRQIFWLTLSLACPAHAARPLITDDARLVDGKSCQLESWGKHSRDSKDFWALPACNFTGNLELTVGGGYENPERERQSRHLLLQAKTLFKPLETNGYGIGLALGTARHSHRNEPRSGLGDAYAYVPLSLSTLDDRLVWHANLGVIRSQEGRRNFGTWGLASEIQLHDSTWAIAETFGQSDGSRYVQAGLRHWVVHNRVQVDVTVGERLHGGPSERWFTVGVRLLSPAFLP